MRVLPSTSRIWVVLCFSLTGLCAGILAQPPDSPDQVVMWVAEGLDDGHPQVLWQALPASYQKDLSSAVHEFAQNADPVFWSQSFSTLRKFQQVLDEKRDFILKHPSVAEMSSASQCLDCYDALIQVLDTVFNSELSDLERLKTLDMESFLAGTVARLLEQIKHAARLTSTSAEMAESWKPVRVILLSADGDNAKVRIEGTDDEFKELEFVKVEGRWIPKDLSDGWSEGIADLRSESGVASGRSPEEREQILTLLTMVEGVLDSLLAAETQEQFNETLQGVLGMAAGAMMGSSED